MADGGANFQGRTGRQGQRTSASKIFFFRSIPYFGHASVSNCFFPRFTTRSNRGPIAFENSITSRPLTSPIDSTVHHSLTTVPSWHLPLPSRFFSLLTSSYSTAAGTMSCTRLRHADLVFFSLFHRYTRKPVSFFLQMFSSPASVTVRITSGKPFSLRIYKLYILPVHELESECLTTVKYQWSDEAGRKWWLLRGGERARSVWLGAYDEAKSRWRPIQIRSPRGGDGVVLATATGTTPGAGQCVAILRPPAKSVLVKPPPRRNCTTRFRTFSLLFSFFFSFCFYRFSGLLWELEGIKRDILDRWEIDGIGYSM